MDKMRDVLVIVDNGHGAGTAGKRSPDGRHREYSWCREAARRIVSRLHGAGVEAVLLVPEEHDVPLSERCRRVADLSRRRNAVLVSVHNNASGSGAEWGSASGWSVFVAPGASGASRRLASLLFAQASKAGLLGNRKTPPCGYWTASLAICRLTPCPAVLTENMFQDNRADVAFLESPGGMDAIVDVHVAAIKDYIGL